MPVIEEAVKSKTEDVSGQIQDIATRPSVVPQIPTSSEFRFLRRFAQEMDTLFEDFGLESRWHMPTLFTRGCELLRGEAGFVPAEWTPRVDVLERKGQFVVRADLPGLSKHDIRVEVTDDMLTIQGERAQKAKEERKECCYSEYSYGSFDRGIPLPDGAEVGKTTAVAARTILEQGTSLLGVSTG